MENWEKTISADGKFMSLTKKQRNYVLNEIRYQREVAEKAEREKIIEAVRL